MSTKGKRHAKAETNSGGSYVVGKRRDRTGGEAEAFSAPTKCRGRKPTAAFVATKFRGLGLGRRALNTKLLHSAAEGIGVEVQDLGSAAWTFDDAVGFL